MTKEKLHIQKVFNKKLSHLMFEYLLLFVFFYFLFYFNFGINSAYVFSLFAMFIMFLLLNQNIKMIKLERKINDRLEHIEEVFRLK